LFTEPAVKDWSCADVASFLEALELGAYAQQFRENDISGKEFLDLTENELKEEFGFSLGHKKKLDSSIQFLKSYYFKHYTIDSKIMEILRNYMSQQINGLSGTERAVLGEEEDRRVKIKQSLRAQSNL